MTKFIINAIEDPDTNPFDRQQLISWWRQDEIRSARVMVVGAGAIGNETLKNLALLGFKNVFIVDFDTIATSNLSRTVLFRREDKGRIKAETAAIRTRELSLTNDVRIDWFHGDVVWELGTGVFRHMDVVLGCLDNAETRFFINRQCWLAQTPWIDAGVFELSGAVSVYVPGASCCYQCAATTERIVAARQRYSCDDYKREVVASGRIATVQVSSAIASALQVQEAVKLISGQEAAVGKKIYFQGLTNDFAVLNYSINPDCLAHAFYPDVTVLPLSSRSTLREFLTVVSEEKHSGPGAVLDFRGDRTFLRFAPCHKCGGEVELYKPQFRISQSEVICSDCKTGKHSREQSQPVTLKTPSDTFSMAETEGRLLEMTLSDLGVPLLHIVSVAARNGDYKYYELGADRQVLFPNMTRDDVPSFN